MDLRALLADEDAEKHGAVGGGALFALHAVLVEGISVDEALEVLGVLGLDGLGLYWGLRFILII